MNAESDLPALLAEATKAAESAGAHLKQQYAQLPTFPEFREWDQLRTTFYELDALTSKIVMEPLQAVHPDAQWLEEDWEHGTVIPTEGDVWVLDAVEGAVQFVHHLPGWVVSLALVREGETVLSILHSPLLNETYTAIRGGGAFLNGEPITPSPKTALSAAMVATGEAPFIGRQPEIAKQIARGYLRLMPAAMAHRNFGPTAWEIADVASGRLDVFWQFGKDPANLLAGALLVTEAGGTVTDAKGNPWQADSESFIAGPAVLTEQVVAALA